jgi:non-heme chloroperoxidase
MPFITTESNRGGKVALYYEAYGDRDPAAFVHAYSLSGDAWEKQVRPFVAAGRRVVLYDRRGFGRSERSSSHYDLETLTSDLNALFETLDLQRAVLIGHSMGGAEVVRYLSKYGSARTRKAVYISAVNPYLAKAPDNPLGVDVSGFRKFQTALLSDRPAALAANSYSRCSNCAPRLRRCLAYRPSTGPRGSQYP